MDKQETALKRIVKKMVSDKKAIQTKGARRAAEEHGIRLVVPEALSGV